MPEKPISVEAPNHGTAACRNIPAAVFEGVMHVFAELTAVYEIEAEFNKLIETHCAGAKA